MLILSARMLSIEHEWVKTEILQMVPMPIHTEAVRYVFARIDWTQGDQIRPYLPLLELLIRQCPETMLNIPGKIIDSLRKDGFVMGHSGLKKMK